MSKLFLISEEEKNRILNLHETATKNLYLLEQPIEYIVKQGDSLSKIANIYNSTVKDISQLNNISNVNLVSVGQRLKIPQTPTQTKSEKSTETQKNSPFKNKVEGNNFRKWVNDNLPKHAKKLKLDASGSFNNSFIINAWNYDLPLKSGKTMKLGDYYNLKTSGVGSDVNKNNIEIMKGFNPNFKSQINFDNLKVNDTTNNFCKPNDDQCAQFVNDISDDISPGDVGHAWNAYVNSSKLGDTIYSSFKNLGDQKNDVIKLWQEIDKRTGEQKWGEKGPLSSEISKIIDKIVPPKYSGPVLKVGDVVGIYNKSSKNHERAFYEGGKAGKGWFVNGKPGNAINKGEGWGMNTHIGRVAVVKNGVPLIFHNVDGTTKSDPPQNLRIAWVKRKNG
jgi:murein DD-endopeptidase MepM/ murein hydrolase activator NlpD